MRKNQTITVKSNEENPEPLELIAQSIIDVSDAWKKIQNSRLTQKTIILLIKDQAKYLSLRDIETILDIVPKLKDYYLKKA